MKNNRHKDLYNKLKDLKVNVKFLVRHSLSYKEEIGKLERTENRLEMIRKREIYKKEITKTNQEIRETKLMIRECQRNFG
jgi:hypothetical protein